MKTVRVEYGRAQEIFTASKADLTDKLHPSLVAAMVEVADDVVVSVGDEWNGETFTPQVAPTRTPANTPLTMRQLRLGLLLIGGFSASFIQDAINAIPDATQRGVAQIWYDESATVEWGHPMTQQLIAGAGLTTEQAAAMWMQAKDLDA
jgi:hypothetical protein